MPGLPKTTEFNKRIPKQKFYENLSVTPAIKKAFTEQIKIIYWRNKLAATTLNIAPGEQVTERLPVPAKRHSRLTAITAQSGLRRKNCRFIWKD